MSGLGWVGLASVGFSRDLSSGVNLARRGPQAVKRAVSPPKRGRQVWFSTVRTRSTLLLLLRSEATSRWNHCHIYRSLPPLSPLVLRACENRRQQAILASYCLLASSRGLPPSSYLARYREGRDTDTVFSVDACSLPTAPCLTLANARAYLPDLYIHILLLED